MSAWIRRLVVHTLLAKNAFASRKAGGKTHPVLERRRLNSLNDVKELKLIRVMTSEVVFQDGSGDPARALVG